MDWFRLWHGTTTDPKFRLIAQECAIETGKVISIWIYILEVSSQSKDRGSMDSFNPKVASCLLDYPIDVIRNVTVSMCANGLIENDRILKWDERQPARDDKTNAARQRAFRERSRGVRKKASKTVTRYVTHRNGTDTDTDTDTDNTNVARSSHDPKITTCPTQNVDAFKMSDYMEIFSDDFPKAFISAQNRSRCADLFKRWHEVGVTPEDVTEAVKWKKSEGGHVAVPWFYENVAVEISSARRQNRKPNFYKRKKTHDELWAEEIAKAKKLEADRNAKQSR